MTEAFFGLFDGCVRVNFTMASYGDIGIDFVLHGDEGVPCDDDFVDGQHEISVKKDFTLGVWTSSTECYFFADMVHWLEAIVCGVHECAFIWEGEGPEGELRWFGRLDGSGRVWISWTGGCNSPESKYELFVDKAQLVRGFYESFRHFVESDRYDPLAYEKLNAGETFALVLEGGELGALADHLAAQPRETAELFVNAMLELASDREAGYPRRATIATFVGRAAHHEIDALDERRWFPPEWECWDRAQRRRHVVEKVYNGGICIGFGEKLRELRSPLVEKWLAEHPDKERQPNDDAP